MVFSSADRDALITRVEQKLGRTHVRRALIRDLVDRTLGALSVASADCTSTSVTVIVSAASVPDLASRLRRAAAQESVLVEGLASATEGRHTVVTMRVAAQQVGLLRAAADRIGAHLVTRGGVA